MQISKKLYTSLVITLLALSTIVAAIPMVSAISTTAPELHAATNPIGGIITSANVGQKVTLVGVAGGPGEAGAFTTVTVYWGGPSGKVLGTTDAAADGSWVLNVTIPSATEGTHYLVATDGASNVGAPIDVTTTLSVGGPGPSRALPGDEVVLTGHGYAANSAVTVTLDSTLLVPANSITLTTPTITTNATGSFSATIVVPSTITVAQYDTYAVTAEDAATNSDDDSLIIDYYIILTPGTGPTGITTTITGRIPASTAYELRFNGAQITTGTSAADGTFSFAYTIPGVLSPAGYGVDVVWATVNIKSNSFTVTSSPTIGTGVAHAVAGTTVTLTGSGFSGLANITLRFDSTVVNSTAADARFGITTLGGAIPAGTNFVVPTLTAGVYAVVVVDQYGATSATGVFFTIDPTPVFQAYTRATAYVQGNVISIYTYSTSNPTVYMVITDPNGMYLMAQNNPGWTDMGVYYNILYSAYPAAAVTLPADAPVGTWNFTVYEDSTMAKILDTNVFSVSAPATLDSVMEGIDDVKDTLDDMTDMIDSIDGDVVTIKGDTTSIKSLINALDLSAASELAGDVETLQMTVEALAATVTSIDDGVATVETTLGTLEGKITAVEGDVATVQTDVGTLQADISDVKASVDSTPAWIAVVLALVAAVAAIFAVITIRQKIAG